MTRKSVILFFCTMMALQTGSAMAHPSPNILQVGGSKGDRVALSGVEYKREGGVGMYRGRVALLGADPVDTSGQREEIEIVVSRQSRQCHPPARLRTQGFFSGNGKTYPFTQGFYSGQRILRR